MAGHNTAPAGSSSLRQDGCWEREKMESLRASSFPRAGGRDRGVAGRGGQAETQSPGHQRQLGDCEGHITLAEWLEPCHVSPELSGLP